MQISVTCWPNAYVLRHVSCTLLYGHTLLLRFVVAKLFPTNLSICLFDIHLLSSAPSCLFPWYLELTNACWINSQRKNYEKEVWLVHIIALLKRLYWDALSLYLENNATNLDHDRDYLVWGVDIYVLMSKLVTFW